MRIDAVTVVVLVASLHVGSRQALAGDASTPPTAEERATDGAPSPDSLVSREDWKRKIDDARKRAEQARRDWQLNAPLRSFEPDQAKIASERVLGDDPLQPGDIVSTDKGLFLYRGRSGADRQTADFVPIAPR